jgi:hypothetical protein
MAKKTKLPIEVFSDVEYAFMKMYPKWRPEHGPRELANVWQHLIDEGAITYKTPPKRAAKLIAEFIEPAF